MSKNKNALLNENTIRRMMKLASVDALSDSFISTKYAPLSEKKGSWHPGMKSKSHPGDHDDDETAGDQGADGDIDDSGHGMRSDDKSDTHDGDDFVKKESKAEDERDATEDELSDMDSEADRERDELEADDVAMEDEVTLTDDEARDIIALADKLRAAMGDEGGSDEAPEEVDAELEMSADMGDEEIAMDAEVEEEPMQEDLYESALAGLNIDLVENKQIQIKNLKNKIYKKVINRLLKESKK